MSPWLNVWKFLGKLYRKKHRRVQKQTFQQVSENFRTFRKSSEVFGNLRKYLEISGSLRKSSEKIRKCRNVLKVTFQRFFEFF